MTRTPLEAVQAYVDRAWNAYDFDVIDEIFADKIYRHEPNNVSSMTRDQWKTRVMHQSAATEPFTSDEILFANDEYCGIVWNTWTRKGEEVTVCGIEVFKVEDGRIVAVWNTPFSVGKWGRIGDAPKAVEPTPMVKEPSDVVVDWLQGAFAEAGIDLPRIGYVMPPRPLSGLSGATVARHGIALNGDPHGHPVSIVSKIGNVQDVDDFAALRNEVEAYKLLNTLEMEFIPKAFFAKSSDRLTNLILEDYNQRAQWDSILMDQEAKDAAFDWLTLDEVRDAVASLAKFHKALDGKVGSFEGDNAASLPDAGQLGELLAFAKLDRANDGDFANALIKAAKDAQDGSEALVHGALTVDNAMLRRGKDPATVGFVDFKYFGVGDPVADVASLITTSLPVEARREHEQALIAIYADATGLGKDEVSARYTGNIGAGLIAYARHLAQGDEASARMNSLMPSIKAAMQAVIDHETK